MEMNSWQTHSVSSATNVTLRYSSAPFQNDKNSVCLYGNPNRRHQSFARGSIAERWVLVFVNGRWGGYLSTSSIAKTVYRRRGFFTRSCIWCIHHKDTISQNSRYPRLIGFILYRSTQQFIIAFEHSLKVTRSAWPLQTLKITTDAFFSPWQPKYDVEMSQSEYKC